MKQTESGVAELSSRLQADLLAFRGKLRGPVPRFRWQLLVPVALIAGAAVLLSLSPKARKSVLPQVTLLAVTHLLQAGAEFWPRPVASSRLDPAPPPGKHAASS